MRAAQLRIRKVGAEVNWADLGAKSLSGRRISDLLSVMPLCRRALVVACLLCCLTGVKAQEEEERHGWNLLIYMVLVHLLALIAIVWGAISMCGRRCRKGTVKTNSNTSTQTDPPEQVAARPGAASHGGGPRLRTSQALADLCQDRVYVIMERGITREVVVWRQQHNTEEIEREKFHVAMPFWHNTLLVDSVAVRFHMAA